MASKPQQTLRLGHGLDRSYRPGGSMPRPGWSKVSRRPFNGGYSCILYPYDIYVCVVCLNIFIRVLFILITIFIYIMRITWINTSVRKVLVLPWYHVRSLVSSSKDWPHDSSRANLGNIHLCANGPYRIQDECTHKSISWSPKLSHAVRLPNLPLETEP